MNEKVAAQLNAEKSPLLKRLILTAVILAVLIWSSVGTRPTSAVGNGLAVAASI